MIIYKFKKQFENNDEGRVPTEMPTNLDFIFREMSCKAQQESEVTDFKHIVNNLKCFFLAFVQPLAGGVVSPGNLWFCQRRCRKEASPRTTAFSLFKRKHSWEIYPQPLKPFFAIYLDEMVRWQECKTLIENSNWRDYIGDSTESDQPASEDKQKRDGDGFKTFTTTALDVIAVIRLS